MVPECDIRENFDTTEYLNIFGSKIYTNECPYIFVYVTNLTRTNVRIYSFMFCFVNMAFFSWKFVREC